MTATCHCALVPAGPGPRKSEFGPISHGIWTSVDRQLDVAVDWPLATDTSPRATETRSRTGILHSYWSRTSRTARRRRVPKHPLALLTAGTRNPVSSRDWSSPAPPLKPGPAPRHFGKGQGQSRLDAHEIRPRSRVYPNCAPHLARPWAIVESSARELWCRAMGRSICGESPNWPQNTYFVNTPHPHSFTLGAYPGYSSLQGRGTVGSRHGHAGISALKPRSSTPAKNLGGSS